MFSRTNKHVLHYAFAVILLLVTVIASFGSMSAFKHAFAATGDTAKVVIGRTETATDVDISVCVQSLSGNFKLADTSTWLSFNNTQLSTSSTLQKTGKFSSTDGYSALAFQQVSQTGTPTTQIWSLRTDFTGDGVTTGQQGLAVSTTRPELIGKVRFTKLAGGTPAVSTASTVLYSLDYPSAPMAITVQNVAYDCNSTPILQANISNSSNCISSLNVTVPNVYSCNFSLTGNADNTYSIVTSPIKVWTGTDNSTVATLTGSSSDDCTIINNGTVSAAITCANIKTSGSSAGAKNVIMTINGTGATDVGDVTIVFASSTLNLKAVLSGTYDAPNSEMKTNLQVANIIPNAQPFNVAPFSYAGSEVLGAAPISTAVDWVLVEVRDNARSTVLERKAALLLKDGSIVNPSTQTGGVVLTSITASANYQIIVRHRNHLAISTDTGIALSSGSTATVDFTTNANVLNSNQTLVKTGVYGLKDGNTSGDNAIDATDRTQTRTGNESHDIYDKRDLNLDGQVDATDRNIVRNAPDFSDGI